MDINPKEIESVKVIGKLNGEDVKMVKTIGGLFIGVGKKSPSGKKDQILSAGSHQGIIAHQIEKQFGSDYQCSLYKSELESQGIIEDKTNFLSEDLKKRGVELYICTNNSNIDFILYKQGLTIGKYNTHIMKNSLEIYNCNFNKEYFDLSKNKSNTANAVAKAMQSKVIELDLDKIVRK